MKTTSWALALAVLVLLVFGITFILNYAGDNGAGGGTANLTDPGTYPQLSLAVKTLPTAEGSYAVEMERGHEGAADFWFTNDQDSVVKVGLNKVGCKCSSVELWTAPAEVLTSRAAEAAGWAGLAYAADLSGIAWVANCLRAAVTEDPVRLLTIEEKVSPRILREEAVEVPPGTNGWIRLKWKGNQLGPQNLTAEIWYGHATLGPVHKLMARAHFHDSLSIVASGSTRDRDLGDLTPDRLPYTGYLFTGSHTRRTLNLKATNIPLSGKVADDPFVVGKPEPTTIDEWRKYEPQKASENDHSPYRCVYRIPYTIHAQTTDGKMLVDGGLFLRRVEVGLADGDGERQTHLVQGAIRGDLLIDGSQRIEISTFQRSSGSQTYTREIRTILPKLEIEIDRKRTASFLSAELTPAAAGEGRAWLLKVKIAPDKANGRFPRQDDPDYRDSAVYLRPVNGEGHPLRIPVHGNANQ